MTTGSVLAVSGMTFESRIAAGAGVDTLHGYRDRALADALIRRISGHAGVISIGVAGGLDPRLPPGTVIVATGVQDGNTIVPCHPAWHDALLRALPDATSGLIAGSDGAVTTVADKSALHRLQGALAVDMESHIAARVAHDHWLPFAALRVVIDPADRPVPPLAVAGMAADGNTDVGAIVMGLLKAPWELGGLIRLARDASRARGALVRARQLVGMDLGAAALSPTLSRRERE